MPRFIGYAELLGRLLAVVNAAPEMVYRPASEVEECSYFHADEPGCLHGHVFAGLGHDCHSVGPNNEESATVAYPELGYRLTSRAKQLATVSQDAQDHGETWMRAVELGSESAGGLPEVERDRYVGDMTVWATLDYVVFRYGDRPSVAAETARPCFHPYREPDSLLAHVFALWGVSTDEAERVETAGECLWSVDVLARLDWRLSARAWAVLVAAESAEVNGFSWGTVAALARQVRVHIEMGEEVDR